jgi:DNA modification methylase
MSNCQMYKGISDSLTPNPDYPMMTLNEIVCCDCLEGMRQLPSEYIPLTVTSPPYGMMRLYGGHGWDFTAVAKELHRITMPGGILVWVVQEQIIDGGESGDSARQRLFLMHLGFRSHQTLVLVRPGSRRYTPNRYGCPPEYAFIFSKGSPRCFHPITDRRRKDMRPQPVSHRNFDGTLFMGTDTKATKYARRSAVWSYAVGKHTAEEPYAFQHPALMPEKMAADLIRSWSDVGDLVFDPFAGAGTTLKMALLNYRNYLGFEINPEYVEIANRRLENAGEYQRQMRDALSPSADDGPA